MATLTISGLKKLKTHSIEIKSPDDIWGLNDQLAELTDELISSGDLSDKQCPDKSINITFTFLDDVIDYGHFNGRLLCDLEKPAINKSLFEKIGYPADDFYYDPYSLMEFALAYEIENTPSKFSNTSTLAEDEKMNAVEKAKKQKDNGEYEEAFDTFWSLASEGYTPAEHQLGNMYFDGQWVEQDVLRAMELYRIASSKGYTDSAFNLATAYEAGNHFDKSLVDAYFWYRLAARRGDEECQEIVEGIDDVAYDETTDSYKFVIDGTDYKELSDPCMNLTFGLNSDENRELIAFLKSRWPEAYKLAKNIAKSEGCEELVLSHITNQISLGDGYSYLADVIEFLETTGHPRYPSLRKTNSDPVSLEIDAELVQLLAKFDEIMGDENPFLNKELSKKATNLAFNDWDPDLNTETDLVIYLREEFPNEVGQATLNQSEDEGQEIDFPTLARVAELIAHEDEGEFIKSINNFYISLGYTKQE